MEEHFAGIIAAVGEDLNREGLIDTPKRAAKAFKFLNNGYNKTLEEVLNGAIFSADTEEAMSDSRTLATHIRFLVKVHCTFTLVPVQLQSSGVGY